MNIALESQPQDFEIIAKNDASSSENKMHSDQVAQQYGFDGALVSGVSVFGYMTQPLVACFGEDWLSHNVIEVKFIKPAYEGDNILVRSQAAHQQENNGSNKTRHFITEACNQDGETIARLESFRPEALPQLNPLAQLKNSTMQISPQREVITWDKIHLDKPSAVYDFSQSLDQSQHFLNWQRDKLSLYQDRTIALLHPYYLLHECNKILKSMYILPAWIHVGSRLVFRRALRIDQALQIYAVPIDKWRRKGHEFIKLYMVVKADNEIALEVEHTAIYKIASTD